MVRSLQSPHREQVEVCPQLGKFLQEFLRLPISKKRCDGFLTAAINPVVLRLSLTRVSPDVRPGVVGLGEGTSRRSKGRCLKL